MNFKLSSAADDISDDAFGKRKEDIKSLANVYASCIEIDGSGILILGKSGSGKSDLCLRMIHHCAARLVADDRVDLRVNKNCLYASAPSILAGLLEVRGVGIVKFNYVEKTKIKLVVQLVDKASDIERLPPDEYYVYENCRLPLLKVYAFTASSVDKIVIKLKAVLD